MIWRVTVILGIAVILEGGCALEGDHDPSDGCYLVGDNDPGDGCDLEGDHDLGSGCDLGEWLSLGV